MACSKTSVTITVPDPPTPPPGYSDVGLYVHHFSRLGAPIDRDGLNLQDAVNQLVALGTERTVIRAVCQTSIDDGAAFELFTEYNPTPSVGLPAWTSWRPTLEIS